MSLHVDSSGSGKPLVMLHGWGMHGGIWGSAAAQLAQHYRVHCVDLPGYGYSTSPTPSGLCPTPSGLCPSPSGRAKRGAGVGVGVGVGGEGALDAIVSVLSAHFDEPVTVCGWSLGGQVALRWAQFASHQVSKLVLVATTPRFVQGDGWDCAMAEETLREFSAALLENYALTLKRFIALQVRGSEHERELLADMRSQLFSRGEPDREALRGGLESLRNTDLRAQLGKVTQAALVVAGERDTLTPPAASVYLAQALPHARLVQINGAAHAPFLSHTESFVKHVTEFMNERI